MIMYVSNEEETFFFVGNAEMTELFKCEKSKTTCCSPKSAIKEEKTRLQRIKYQIRRKDTEIQNTQFIEVRYYTVINSFIIIYVAPFLKSKSAALNQSGMVFIVAEWVSPEIS